jgi:hypothetical protein
MKTLINSIKQEVINYEFKKNKNCCLYFYFHNYFF